MVRRTARSLHLPLTGYLTLYLYDVRVACSAASPRVCQMCSFRACASSVDIHTATSLSWCGLAVCQCHTCNQTGRTQQPYHRRQGAWLVGLHALFCRCTHTYASTDRGRARIQVEAALSDERQEVTSIGDLKTELLGLQAQVETAHERLHLTQGRVAQNVKRLTELKSEARSLERVNRAAADSVLESKSDHPEVVEHVQVRLSLSLALQDCSLMGRAARIRGQMCSLNPARNEPCCYCRSAALGG